MAGKVISEITFGVWPHVFARNQNALWWNPPHPLLTRVIPNYPKPTRDTRAKFEERLEYFVTLRNRVMHQEAVFQGVAALNRPVLPINTLHAQLIETIGWIHTDAAALAACLDHFDETHQHGKAHIEVQLRQLFNL